MALTGQLRPRLFCQEVMKGEIETHLFQKKNGEPKHPQGPPANQTIGGKTVFTFSSFLPQLTIILEIIAPDLLLALRSPEHSVGP